MTLRKTFLRDGEEVVVSAEPIGGDHWRVRVGDRVLEFRAAALGDGGVRLVSVGADAGPAATAYGAAAGALTGAAAGRAFMVRVGGRTHTIELPSARRAGAAGHGDGTVRAPMTGTVLEVRCAVGDAVLADQILVVLSAMKMEHKLVAGVAGTVARVTVVDGATVDQDTVLVEVEPTTDPGDENTS